MLIGTGRKKGCCAQCGCNAEPELSIEVVDGHFGCGTARLCYDALLLPDRIILFSEIEELSIDGLDMVHSPLGPPKWPAAAVGLSGLASLIGRYTCGGDCMEIAFTARLRGGRSFCGKACCAAFAALKEGFWEGAPQEGDGGI